MVKEIWLKLGERPPDDEDCIRITELPGGQYEISASLQAGVKAVSFPYTGPLDKPLETVREIARMEAEKVGLHSIYIEVDDPPATETT